MEQGDIHNLSYQDLACYTDNFCESNYLGHFQFGKFYRGKIVHDGCTHYVMVKIWEVSKIYNYYPGDNESRLTDEVILLRQHRATNHPNLVKLYGYCCEGGHLGVVYDFKPFDSVFNLVPKDDFTWMQRIKVILRFASLLSFLHTIKSPLYKPFIVRNLDCAHIVLDKDYNPKLCDFGLITGGIFPDRTTYKSPHVIGSYGYIDTRSYDTGHPSDRQDIYAFGVILLSMISKRVYTEEDRLSHAPCVPVWALEKFFEYDNDDSDTNPMKPKFSLVHPNLAGDPVFDPSDGQNITALGLECVDDDIDKRPTMNEVLSSLLNLNVVKKHADLVFLE